MPVSMRGQCPYTPTCSEYGLVAVERYGAKGVWLTLWRIQRCSSETQGGYDPVPKAIGDAHVPRYLPALGTTGAIGAIAVLYAIHRSIQSAIAPKAP